MHIPRHIKAVIFCAMCGIITTNIARAGWGTSSSYPGAFVYQHNGSDYHCAAPISSAGYVSTSGTQLDIGAASAFGSAIAVVYTGADIGNIRSDMGLSSSVTTSDISSIGVRAYGYDDGYGFGCDIQLWDWDDNSLDSLDDFDSSTGWYGDSSYSSDISKYVNTVYPDSDYLAPCSSIYTAGHYYEIWPVINCAAIDHAVVDYVRVIAYSSLYVDLLNFTGVSTSSGVELTWETSMEIGNAGWNVYRSTCIDEEYRLINESVVSPYQYEYAFLDDTPEPECENRYIIEDIGVEGNSKKHEAIRVIVTEEDQDGSGRIDGIDLILLARKSGETSTPHFFGMHSGTTGNDF